MKKDTVKFNATLKELGIIKKCAVRAEGIYVGQGVKFELRSCMMDLDACHSNGCPLDFERLLQADTFNFLHDIQGIAKHIDRRDGTLKDCFLPRFTRKEAPAKRTAGPSSMSKAELVDLLDDCLEHIDDTSTRCMDTECECLQCRLVTALGR